MTSLGQTWNPALISALAAVCGSIVGALGSSVSAFVAQRHLSQRDLITKAVFHREQLYSEFISEAAQAYGDAIQHTFQDPSQLIPSYALLSRMRLSSSMHVVESAQRVIDHILETYRKPNLSPEELHALAGERTDPLRDFSGICRRELESLWKGV